jgi:hypothetical protein
MNKRKLTEADIRSMSAAGSAWRSSSSNGAVCGKSAQAAPWRDGTWDEYPLQAPGT